MNFEETVIINHYFDNLFHIIGLVGIFRHNVVQRVIDAVRRIVGLHPRRIFQIIGRHVRKQGAQVMQTFHIVFTGQMTDAALACMGLGAAQLFGCHIFMGHRFHHIGSGNEHVAGIFDHQDKIGDCRRIDRPAGAGSHHRRYLRNHPGSQSIAQKNFGIAAQTDHALLNARPAGVIQTDQRRPHAQGLIHNFTDFLGKGFGQAAAENSEILGKNKHQPPVDIAVTGHHTIAGIALFIQTEIFGTMTHQHIHFHEAAFVHQVFDAFACGQFALGVLLFDALFAAAEHGLRA